MTQATTDPVISPLPPLTITGAQVLRPDGLSDAPLSLAGGVIVAKTGREIDLSGYLVLPGIVDAHGDGFERHLAPRRGALGSPKAGLQAADAELAANGITTAVLAQFFSWEGGMRGPDFAERMAEAWLAMRADSQTDMQLQLRLEINLLDEYDRALALIDHAGIKFVVFNDHLPHKALAAGKRPPRLTGQALKSGRSPEAHLALLQGLHARRDEVPDALEKLAQKLTAQGIRLGSHDDHFPEDHLRMARIGAVISEFPETEAAAQTAFEAGHPVIMGAPNLVRGGSHDGRVSAAQIIEFGYVTALASDYHYPAPRQAAWKLVQGGMPLQQAWALVSSGPAELLGLTDRGHITEGLRADLTILEAETKRVAATITGGRLAYLSGDIAQRFLS